jgi:DNA-binding IclR family transcriptional regulator
VSDRSPSSGHPGVQSLGAGRKTLAVLARLGAFPTGATLSELAETFGLAPSTMHRLLRDLVESGFAIQDVVTKRYWMGPEIERIARLRPSHHLLRAVAHPFLQSIVDRTGETVFLSVLDGFEILSIDCLLSGQRLRMWGEPGTRGPLHATSQGKAILSQLPVQTQQGILDAITLQAYTSRTLVDRDLLLEELEETRLRGFSVNDQERDDGVVSIAVPVDAGNGLLGATSVAAPMQRLPLEELVSQHADFLMKTGRGLSARMATLTGSHIELYPDPSTTSGAAHTQPAPGDPKDNRRKRRSPARGTASAN